MKISLKLLVILGAVIYFICLFIPEMMVRDLETSAQKVTEAEVFTPDIALKNNSEGIFTLFCEENGEIIKVKERDFLIATVALEMGPLCHSEALKAQAVAARSFYRYKKALGEFENYDFSVDRSAPYVYADRKYFENKWGEEFESYVKIIANAVDSTENEIISYNGEAACCCFFSMSGGVTESSQEVFGSFYPYLVPVASPYDSLSPYFETTSSFTADEIESKLKEAFPQGNFDFSLPYNQWFSDIKYNTGCSVKSINICSYSVTGRELREALGLRSATFTVDFDGENFIIKTKGYGHGVGMSQTGALYMAQSGSSYREILSHYYPDTVLIN